MNRLGGIEELRWGAQYLSEDNIKVFKSMLGSFKTSILVGPNFVMTKMGRIIESLRYVKKNTFS